MEQNDSNDSALLTNILSATADLAEKPQARWSAFTQHPQLEQLSFESCVQGSQLIFGNVDSGDKMRPCWIPDHYQTEQTNLFAWLRETGCNDVEEFHRWTVQNRSEFWELALEALQVAFREEPDAIFAEGESSESPELLPGARLNIAESCWRSSDQVAVISGNPGGSLQFHSYGELQKLANRVSNGLVEDGFSVGDRIGVIMPVTFTSIAVYLGIIQAGLVVVSIADSFAAPEIENRLKIADAQAVFTYESLNRAGKSFPLGERVRKATQKPVTFVDDDSASWNAWLDGQSDKFDPVPCHPHDPVNILFSSGTTGDPKAIPWNHTTPIKCATDGHLHHDIRVGDVVAWPTSLGWMMGPWLIFATLMNEGTIAVFEDAPAGPEFGKFIQDAKVNMLGLVPSMVRLWRAQQSMESFDWTSIRCFSSTGEASNASDMFYLSWLAGFRPIIEYCGGTEIGGGYISSTVLQPNYPATFSTPAFGLDIRILDEQQQNADEGELFLVPPSLGLSVDLLNRDHEATYFAGCPQDETGKRLRRHGDFFKRLNNGYFAAGGRTDDTMNLGGIKVSSVEIEKTLNRLDEVSETAAIALPFHQTGPDQLVVIYVLADGFSPEDVDQDALLSQMNKGLREQLNPLFKIRRIERKDALPRTASNKVMRRLLRDEYLANISR